MKCPTCGYQTQPGAKFCVQCGTTLAGVSAAETSTFASTQSATPRAATPAQALAPTAASTIKRPVLAPIAPQSVVARSGSGTSALAVSEASSSARRRGIAVALIVAILFFGIGGFLAYRALFPGERNDSVAGTDSPKASASSRIASADTAKEATSAAPSASQQSGGSAQPVTLSNTVEPGKGTAAVAAPATASSPNTGAAAPGTIPPSTPRSASTQARLETAGDARSANPSSPPPISAKSAAPAPVITAQAGTARPAAAQGDRWEQMHQAMVRCAREEFLTRFVCEQRVGRQYCEGYWGTVPQCPGAQQRDRGQ